MTTSRDSQVHFASLVISPERVPQYASLLGRLRDAQLPEGDYLFFAWMWEDKKDPAFGIASWLASFSNQHHAAIGRRPAGKRGAKTVKFKPWAREDMPRVLFLDPGCTRDVTGRTVRAPVGEEDKVIMAHPRRAHLRTLRSERWGDRQGDVVWVKASWVGPKKWAHGGVQYRIVDNRNG